VVVDEDSIFGPMTSNETILEGLVKNELYLFCHLHLKFEHYLLPLNWWKFAVSQHIFCCNLDSWDYWVLD
jgi:hypothetical protein